MAIPFVIFPIAQQWIDSAVAGMLNGATPIFTAIVASLLLWQLPGRLQIVGLLVGFAGILAIALPSAGEAPTAAIGVVMVIFATVCYAFATNIVAPLQQRYGSLPVMAQGAVDSPGAGHALRDLRAHPVEFRLALVVGDALPSGVLGTGLAMVMMGVSGGKRRAHPRLLHHLPDTRWWLLVLGVVFRDEVVSPISIVGIGLVIGGALLASRRETNSEQMAPSWSKARPAESGSRCQRRALNHQVAITQAASQLALQPSDRIEILRGTRVFVAGGCVAGQACRDQMGDPGGISDRHVGLHLTSNQATGRARLHWPAAGTTRTGSRTSW